MMEKKEKNIQIHSVKYNFVMNIILKISQYIFPLITLPYITRTLGTIGNGKVAFAASVVSYFSMFAQLGIPTYGIRACAACRDNKDKLTKTVHELVVINGGAAIVSYLFLVIGIMLVPKLHEDSTLMLINSMTLFLNLMGMEWLYQAIEQYQYITIRNITFKIISVILMFVMIHDPSDYILYGALQVFSAGGSNVLNLWNARKFLTRKSYRGEYNFRQHMKPIWTFFALSVAVSVYTSMDTVMLGFLSSDEEVAYYSLSTKIKMVLATTISALGPVLLPRIAYCLNNGQERRFMEYLKKSLHFVIIASASLALYFMVMAPETIQILGGNSYASAVCCMRIITFAIIPLGIGNIACQQVLTPLGKEKFTMYSTICGACINFVANTVMIPLWGAAGASVATVLAECLVAIIQVKFAWIELKSAFVAVSYRKIILANVIALIALFAVKNLFFVESAFITMIATCISFFGIYLITLLVFRDELIVKYGGQVLCRIFK
ncbi:flippase [Coprococcus intestinihominis]